jgi:Mrp family chromosome partitioning ATPase
LWTELRNQYDDIVLDLPPAAVTRMGLTAATQCDGVVVVIEAEKTRAPVVEHLLASLQAVGARTIGTVLNRRRFHLPPRIYRWL